MSNNVTTKNSSYYRLLQINTFDFRHRSVLLIGASWMAHQFARALKSFDIREVTVISRKETSAKQFHKEYGFNTLTGGFEENLPELPPFDLVIIATPVHVLLPAASCAIQYNQTNLLIEKPGSVYPEKLAQFKENGETQKVRIGYNRLLYPNFHKLKELVKMEGGVSSCRYTFTEWLHSIDFEKDEPEAYERWGISNSLHVISMAHELIGFPCELSTFHKGHLSWHPSGSNFVGAGITEKKIPFSYQADWDSGGRWGIDVITKENVYRLIPLEDLYVCKKGGVLWEKVPFDLAFPDLKQGIAEEIAVMLDEELCEVAEMMTIDKAIRYNEMAEEIFGYS